MHLTLIKRKHPGIVLGVLLVQHAHSGNPRQSSAHALCQARQQPHLAQPRTVTMQNHRNRTRQLASDPRSNPSVMGMNHIGLKLVQAASQARPQHLPIDPQLLSIHLTKDRAGIGHHIAHAWNRKRQFAPLAAPDHLQMHGVKASYARHIFPHRQEAQHALLKPLLPSPPHQGVQSGPASGPPGPLGQKVKNAHGSRQNNCWGCSWPRPIPWSSPADVRMIPGGRTRPNEPAPAPW